MYIIRPYQIVHHALTRHTRKDIMPKQPKTGPFPASRGQRTVISSVFADAISVKNVVRFVTRFDNIYILTRFDIYIKRGCPADLDIPNKEEDEPDYSFGSGAGSVTAHVSAINRAPDISVISTDT